LARALAKPGFGKKDRRTAKPAGQRIRGRFRCLLRGDGPPSKRRRGTIGRAGSTRCARASRRALRRLTRAPCLPGPTASGVLHQTAGV